VTDYTIASPNGNTWSIQSAAASKDGRFHDLAFLQQGAGGANILTKSRPGVLGSPPWLSNTQVPGAGQVFISTGLGWSVTPFAAVVERSSLVGSYVVVSTAVGFGTLSTADPSQTTVYRLDVQVLDGALGDNGGTSLTTVKVTRGTPGAGTPTAPTNSVPLGIWTVPANITSLSAGMWTGARKSAGFVGSVRMLLEGDSLADAGFMSGEMRDTSAIVTAPTPGTIDRWNAAASVWQRVLDLSGAAVAQNFFPGAMGSSTSASYVVPANTAGCAFTAPSSGIVEVEWGADLRSSASNSSALLSPQVRAGGSVGVGTVFLAASDNQSVSTNSQTNNTTCSMSVFVTGLTPGATYNVQLLWKATNTGTVAGGNPRVLVSPQAA
jgi:hypothetical protein